MALSRVLVVDDDPINRTLLEKMLSTLGYASQSVGHGKLALERARGGEFHAILMDCEMPVMDGYAATQAIRREEGSERHVPIIALTANATKDDQQRCLDCGMDDLLTKPFRLDSLRRIVDKWIHPEKRASIEHHASVIDEYPLLDVEALKMLRGLSSPSESDLLTELIQMFQEIAPKYLETLRHAVEARDSHKVEKLAHKLKGTSRNLGVTGMACLLEVVEDHGRKKAVCEVTDAILKQIYEKHEQAQAILASEWKRTG